MPFNPDNLHAVVFDMDGVLIDSEILYRKFADETFKELGFTLTDELHLSTVGVPGPAGEALIRDAMGDSFPFEEFDNVWRGKMASAMMDNVPLKPGVREILNHLDELDIPSAVATSSSYETANHHLQRADLLQYFDALITGDMVENGKPHPEPYLLAAEKLEVNPEYCLALEDSYNGVRSAHAAGMQTIMVPDLLASNAEMEALSIAVMKDMFEVIKRFELG